MGNYLKFSFWFNYFASPFSIISWWILGIFALILLVAIIVFGILKKKKGPQRKMFSRLFTFAIYNFVIAILVAFFNYEEVPLFASRAWILLWLIEIIFYLGFIFKPLFFAHNRKEKNDDYEQYKKYLPKSRR